MNRLRGNMRRFTAFFLAMFLALGAYFSYAVFQYGSRWFNSSYNPRIRTAQSSVAPGDVLDRNGVLLAGSNAQGQRVYPQDKALRLSVAHVVGDDGGLVPGGAQAFHAGRLLGFRQGLISRIQQAISPGPRQGSDITLTIDAELQKYVASIFPQNKQGAVVLLNYRTGEIYALYSAPTFDLAAMDLVDQQGSQLVNRATQGQYTPGSIFKTITLAAALKNIGAVEQQEFDCEGERQVGAFLISDNQHEGHGHLTLSGAFNVSCNLTFAQLGVQMRQSALKREAEAFAFNDNFLFQDLMVYQSTFPSAAMEEGKLAWTSVGQGDLVVTPLHMAMIAGAIANDGVMMEPRLIAAAEGEWGTGAPTVYRRCTSIQAAQQLKAYMLDCVENGSASRGSFTGGTVAGKTGTAQVASSGQGVEPHSWFMGFNDDPDMPLAVAVIIEQGGSGANNAAPLAGNVMGRASRTLKIGE